MPSKPDALELRSRVRHMLRLDEDLADFYARCRTSRALRPIAQLGAGRLLRSPDLWEDIVKGICTTIVTWSRTRTMVASITALTAAATSTAAYGAFPTPDEILTAGVQYLTTEAGVGYRARSILNLAEAGDHIVDSSSLYGGTYNLLHYTFPKMGINTTFIKDPDDLS